MQILNNMPEDLTEKAVSLEDAGISGYAWHLPEAKKVLHWLEEQHYTVLGGDLYLYIRNRGVVYPLRENWYFKPEEGASSPEKQSIKQSREYLEKFEKHPLSVDIIVDFVVESR